MSEPSPLIRKHNARSIRARRIIALAAVPLAVACAERSVEPSAGSTLTLGTWGGENAAFIATDSVTHVHVGCTFGDLPAKIVLDKDGRFTTNGSYVLRAYPIYIGPRLPAQFSGQVVGKTLTFAVAVNDTVNKTVVALGPATVVLGREPNMGPCPVCAVPKKVP